MNESFRPGSINPPSPGPNQWSPPPSNVPSPGFVSETSVQTVKKGGKSSRLVVGVILALIAGGGVFAVRAALGGSEGPASSEEAVEQFFSSLDSDDLVGMAEVIHPAERESIIDPLFRTVEHAKRLELIEPETNMSEATFLGIDVKDLSFSVDKTDERLHNITTTGGTVTAPKELNMPAGPLFKRFGISDTPSSGTTSTDLGSSPMRLAVVEHDGSWYISGWYSVAEEVRRSEGRAFPGIGNGPTPVGASTPDAVVEEMVRSMVELDARKALALMDPEEAAVMYDYSPLYLDGLVAELDEVSGDLEEFGFSWSVESVDFSSADQNGRKIVRLEEVEVNFQVEDSEQGVEASGSIALTEGCLVADIDGDEYDSCDDAEDIDPQEALRETLEALEASDATIATLDKLMAVQSGVTVVERDGRWYLSTMPSMIEMANDYMAVLEPGDLVAVADDIERVAEDPDEFALRMFEVFGELESQGTYDGLEALGEALAGAESRSIYEGDRVEAEEWESVAEALEAEPEIEIDPERRLEIGPGEMPAIPNPENEQIPDDLAAVLLPQGWWVASLPPEQVNQVEQPVVASAENLATSVSGLKVIQFDGNIDASVLPPNWIVEERNGVLYVLGSEGEFDGVMAFVGEYGVWSPDGQTLGFIRQVESLS